MPSKLSKLLVKFDEQMTSALVFFFLSGGIYRFFKAKLSSCFVVLVFVICGDLRMTGDCSRSPPLLKVVPIIYLPILNESGC